MIKDKVIVITGGSTGIGYALYKQLYENNEVFVLSRNKEKIKNTLIKKENYYQVDVSDYNELKNTLKDIINRKGYIDILILNAGIGLNSDNNEFNAENIEYVINVNFISHIHAIESVIDNMKKRKKGTIVSISSIADSRGLPNSPAYSASKAGLTTFIEGLEINLSQYGINVIIVRPGFIKTSLTAKSEYKMPFIMSADKAAKIILKGIEKKKRRIEFPFPMVFLTNIIHCLPHRIYRFLIKFWYFLLKK